MSSSTPPPNQQSIELSYTIHNPPTPTTITPKPPIIFLHGLETSSLQYALVLPFLTPTSPHPLYLVDLPGHSTSKKTPLSLQNAISGLTTLLTTKIPGGRAHIVGSSLGGYIALHLATLHPDLCLSVFTTGSAPLTPGTARNWIMQRPRLLATVQLSINTYLPITEKMFWYPIGCPPFPALRKVMKENSSYDLLVAGYSACAGVTLEDLAEIKGVRVAVIAGAKRDDVEGTREAGTALRKGDERCRAFVIRKAVHLWDLQFPELFADGLRAWVEGAEMPAEFEVLE